MELGIPGLDCTTQSVMRGGIPGHLGGFHRLAAGETLSRVRDPVECEETTRMPLHDAQGTGRGLLQPSAIPMFMYARMCTPSILPGMLARSQPGSHIRMDLALHVLRGVAQHYRNGSQPA